MSTHILAVDNKGRRWGDKEYNYSAIIEFVILTSKHSWLHSFVLMLSRFIPLPSARSMGA